MTGCGHVPENGSLLVSSVVYWSRRPEPRFVFPEVILSTKKFSAHYYSTRPMEFAAQYCRDCGICTVSANGQEPCEHEFESGFVFPYSKLRWMPGADHFEPNFFFPFSDRGRNGLRTEVLFDPGFTLSIGGARCPAARCLSCKALRIFTSPARGAEVPSSR